MASPCWSASCASPSSRRGTSGRTHRRGEDRHSTARGHRRTCATGQARRRADPGASGERSRRAVSAARTIVASRSSDGVERPNSFTITSKVQSSPRWLQNTFSMSNGVASKRSATASTSDARDEQERRGRIDEAADQPRASDAIDLGSRSRDPDGAAAPVALRDLVGGDGRQLRLLPADVAAFENFRSDVAAAKPGGGALAELLALIADDDDGLAGHP